ncbi:MAG: hypothetical protein ACSLFF_10310 [Solirubrobacterales bacterium]
MEFLRRGKRSFSSTEGEFKIRRPSGPVLKRDGLKLSAPGRDYEILLDGTQIWLVDGEREVGYARGSQNTWEVIIGDRSLALDQPKPGVPHTFVGENERQIGQFAGKGFPMRSFRSEGDLESTDEQTAFLAAVVLTGWRESDRGMLAAGSSGSGDQ